MADGLMLQVILHKIILRPVAGNSRMFIIFYLAGQAQIEEAPQIRIINKI
jgi:hypothetical protein